MAGAIGLFRGPMHVMEWANEELLALVPRECIGIPVRECFPEEEFADTQAAMDHCLWTGEYIRLIKPHGTLWLGPRFDARGRVYGVRSHFVVSPLPADVLPPTILRIPRLEVVENLAVGGRSGPLGPP
jgi:hypothetical protein